MSEMDEAVSLGDAVQKLRISYEQYFAGVERFEPLKERDVVKRELRRLLSVRSNNTAFRFRVQTTQATLVTFENHWNRIVRQIEEGTFKRDRLKVARREQALRDATADVDLVEDDVRENDVLDLSDDFEEFIEEPNASAVADLLGRGVLVKPASGPRPSLFTASDDLDLNILNPIGPRTVAPRSTSPLEAPGSAVISMAAQPAATNRPRPKPLASAAPRPVVAPAAATTPRPMATASASTVLRPAASPADDSIKKLHEAFVTARSKTGESKPVSVETLAETVRKQTAAVKAQHGWNDVEFKVAIKDGKAVLKAVPK
ncbi:MAG: hypothetical protein H7Z43_07220 [Clostridia bacterium]|nr:hypothetical protein [Deltaproteobacteria bacterium]